MEKVSRPEHVRNEEVLQRVEEEKECHTDIEKKEV
jgi:hypothetical protein